MRSKCLFTSITVHHYIWQFLLFFFPLFSFLRSFSDCCLTFSRTFRDYAVSPVLGLCMHDSFVESLKRQLTFNSPFLLHPGNNSSLTRTSSHWHFIVRVLLPASFLHNRHFHFCAVTHGCTNKDHNVACDCKRKTNVKWGGVSSHQWTRLMVNQMWSVSFRCLHQFGRSSRRWSDPRCPLCRTAAALFSGPSERSDQSGAEKTGKREGTPLKGWFRLSRVRWDELTAFYIYLRIPDNRARTACTCIRKYI